MFENEELETSQNSLSSEFERSEGEGSWNGSSDEIVNNQESDGAESVDTETHLDDPELQQDQEDLESPEKSDESDDEQKNTPQEGIRRVLTYSEYISQ
jgi:hypothetical protein